MDFLNSNKENVGNLEEEVSSSSVLSVSMKSDLNRSINIGDVSWDNERLNVKINFLQKKSENLALENKRLTKVIDENKKMIGRLREEVNEINKAYIKDTSSMKTESNRIVEELQRKIEIMTAKITSLSDKNVELSKVHKNYEDVKQLLQHQDIQLFDQNQMIERLKAILAESQLAHCLVLQHLKEKSDEDKFQVVQPRPQRNTFEIAMMRNDMIAMAKECVEFRDQILAKDLEIASLKDAVDMKTNQVSTYKEECESAFNACTRYRTEIAECKHRETQYMEEISKITEAQQK